MIVKRVQHQLDSVIVKHVFPARKAGANLLGLVIEADENRVQVFVVIAEVGFGALRDRLSVTGNALHELVDLRHLACPCRRRASSPGNLPGGSVADPGDGDLGEVRWRCRKDRRGKAKSQDCGAAENILPPPPHARLRVSPVLLR